MIVFAYKGLSMCLDLVTAIDTMIIIFRSIAYPSVLDGSKPSRLMPIQLAVSASLAASLILRDQPLEHAQEHLLRVILDHDLCRMARLVLDAMDELPCFVGDY